MKKVMSLILIISGIILFLYPSMSNLYTDYQQKKMIRDWEANTFEAEAAAETFNEQDTNKSLNELNEVFNKKEEKDKAENQNEKNTEKHDQSIIESEAQKKTDQNQNSGLLGVIEIDKINLRLPILHGASERNLDIASGLLNGTSLPGTSGNSAIAAHRSRSYGRMFNRLDEIRNGDVVTVKSQKGTYQYQVYETLVVKPEDVSVLSGNNDEKTLTLITCTPIDTATHRLIVKAKLKP